MLGAPTKEAWEETRRRWARFAAWESDRARAAAPGFAEAVAWMSEAWELAARLSEGWGSRAAAEDHWRHLAGVQRALRALAPAP